MTNAIQTITTALNEVFTPMDVEVLEATKVWAKERGEACKAFWASDEATALRRNQHALYAKLFALAGGKTWYNVLGRGYSSVVENFVTKNCAATAAKRNGVIAKKLEAVGVIEVTETVFVRINDGFNGVFSVMTNAGKKVVVVETIRAGGYNIQCLHLRVLVKVR